MVQSSEKPQILISSVPGSTGHKERIQAQKAGDAVLWNALVQSQQIEDSQEVVAIKQAEVGRLLRNREAESLFGIRVAQELLELFKSERVSYHYAVVAKKEDAVDFSTLRVAFAVIMYPDSNSVTLYDVRSGKPLLRISQNEYRHIPTRRELINLLISTLNGTDVSGKKSVQFDAQLWRDALPDE